MHIVKRMPIQIKEGNINYNIWVLCYQVSHLKSLNQYDAWHKNKILESFKCKKWNKNKKCFKEYIFIVLA